MLFGNVADYTVLHRIFILVTFVFNRSGCCVGMKTVSCEGEEDVANEEWSAV